MLYNINVKFSLIRRNDSFVDATPEIQGELKSELERVAKVCNVHRLYSCDVYYTFLTCY